jgi:translation initiation factor IF-2
VAGAEWGRVRALINDAGAQIKEAGPSVPVEVLGFNGTPGGGDRVAVVESEARAREVTDYRTRQKRDRLSARGAASGRSLADMMRDLKEGAAARSSPSWCGPTCRARPRPSWGRWKSSAPTRSRRGCSSRRRRHLGVRHHAGRASGAVVLGFNVRAHKEAREAA